MGIEFACRHCGRKLFASDRSEGHRILCARCGQFSDVPAGEMGVHSAPPPPEQFPPDQFHAEQPPPYQPPPYQPPPDQPPYGEPPISAEGVNEPPPADYAYAAPSSHDQGNPFGHGNLPGEEDENPYSSPTQYGSFRRRSELDTFAILSLIIGLVGFGTMFCCMPFPFGIMSGLIGIVLGAKGLESNNPGVAVAGIVLCSIQAFLSLMIILLFGAAIFFG